MKKNSMPIGVDNFQKLRSNNYYFVGKTKFIQDLIDGHSDITLITRPRRFGANNRQGLYRRVQGAGRQSRLAIRHFLLREEVAGQA